MCLKSWGKLKKIHQLGACGSNRTHSFAMPVLCSDYQATKVVDSVVHRYLKGISSIPTGELTSLFIENNSKVLIG